MTPAEVILLFLLTRFVGVSLIIFLFLRLARRSTWIAFRGGGKGGGVVTRGQRVFVRTSLGSENNVRVRRDEAQRGHDLFDADPDTRSLSSSHPPHLHLL